MANSEILISEIGSKVENGVPVRLNSGAGITGLNHSDNVFTGLVETHRIGLTEWERKGTFIPGLRSPSGAYYTYPEVLDIETYSNVIWISTTGDDVNDGVSGSVQTFARAVSLAGTNGLIIAEPGHYYANNFEDTTYLKSCLRLGNSQTLIGADPKNTIIENEMSGPGRDSNWCHGHVDVKIYGIRIRHNTGGSAGSYTAAIIRWSIMEFHNCVYEPINGNTRSINYFNGATGYVDWRNCTFQPVSWIACYSACNYARVYDAIHLGANTNPGAAVNSSFTSGGTVDADFKHSGDNVDGVYGGAYSWDASNN